jgi:hypothetical protein
MGSKWVQRGFFNRLVNSANLASTAFSEVAFRNAA